jgi:ABC-type nitrate/sulfonate/bicarbonate transport system permease component
MSAQSTNEPEREGKQPAAGAAAPRAADVRPSDKPASGWPPLFALRREIPRWLAVLFGLLCIALCAGGWWYLTKGAPEERMVSPSILPSPQATFGDFRSLWFDRALTRNTYASLKRVTLGFGLAAVVGVPLGMLCGCFRWMNAFFAPLTIMGRNIPIAALIPLTFSFFGIGEFQKIMFIFIACVAFIVMDSATAIADVSGKYLDTAYTLGASRRQIILKVLVPLALPSVFDSLRLLFGLAFGYIMLAELIKFGGEAGGLGDIIMTSQRRGLQSHILLVLMIIPLVALAIDRLLYWVQRELFPYKYESNGILLACVRAVLRGWEDLKLLIVTGVLSCWAAVKGVLGRPAAHAPSTPEAESTSADLAARREHD